MSDQVALSERESAEVAAANAAGKPTVVFVHGLWLLPNSWENWEAFFQEAGYSTVAVAWPNDPETTAEALENPDALAGNGIGDIVDHAEAVIKQLDAKPALIGHSFGGLFVQILAGRGVASATVSISPAPSRGVLALPVSTLKSAFPVLGNPLNRSKAIRLNEEQFKYGFGNALSDEESKQLWEKYSVAGPGKPLFEGANANLNPATDAKVDTKNPDRGPLLVLGGTQDHTVPPAIYKASYKHQTKNDATTELAEFDRSHSLTIDSGWKEVAEKSLEFIKANA
jgi:pimeloyl-ACP methyl ester carboxylesterase